jgi:hypothetical protein
VEGYDNHFSLTRVEMGACRGIVAPNEQGMNWRWRSPSSAHAIGVRHGIGWKGCLAGRLVHAGSYVIRFIELEEAGNDDPEREFLVWENTVIAHAANLDDAYCKIGAVAEGTTTP